MSTPVILGLGSSRARNTPSSGTWGSLWHALQNVSSRAIRLNAYGETLGPGPDQGWDPHMVADWVASGNIWIDWCGYPMYYIDALNGAFQTQGAKGFQTFAIDLGFPFLAHANFVVPGNDLFGTGSTPSFNRALQLTGSLVGIYINKGSFALGGSIFGSGSAEVTAGGYTQNFALRSKAGGYYFYASHNAESPSQVGVPWGPQYFPESDYARFIDSVLHNQLSGIEYLPYSNTPSVINAKPPATTQPGYNASGVLTCPTGYTKRGSTCYYNGTSTTKSSSGTSSSGSGSTPKKTSSGSSSGSGSGSLPTLSNSAQGIPPVAVVAGAVAVGGGLMYWGWQGKKKGEMSTWHMPKL